MKEYINRYIGKDKNGKRISGRAHQGRIVLLQDEGSSFSFSSPGHMDADYSVVLFSCGGKLN